MKCGGGRGRPRRGTQLSPGCTDPCRGARIDAGARDRVTRVPIEYRIDERLGIVMARFHGNGSRYRTFPDPATAIS